MVKITSVIPQTLASESGIKENDILLKINGREINDVLDYRFYLAENHITIEVKRDWA